MALGQGGTCTATVTDTAAGSKSDPAGNVDFTSDNLGGDFDFTTCTLVSDGVAGTFTSTCSVEYTGDTAGTDTVTAIYDETSSAIHASSSDTDTVVVTQRSTSTLVDCESPVAIDEASTCQVTVTDTAAGSKSDPAGNVDFTSDNLGGDFDFTTCTLVSDGVAGTFTSTCSVEYTGDTAGTDTVTAIYDETSSAIHASSSDTDTVVVTQRSTSTLVDCESPVAIDEASTCQVTVTDTAAGSKSDPAGNVDFTSDNLGGDFDFTTCTLVSDGVAGTFTSTCSVEYTGDTAGTDTVTAIYDETSSAIHASSSDTDTVVVTQRSTSTLVDCESPVAIDEASTCQVTVTDTAAGSKSDPAGNVDFTSDNLGGDFDFTTCTLVSDGVGRHLHQHLLGRIHRRHRRNRHRHRHLRRNLLGDPRQ